MAKLPRIKSLKVISPYTLRVSWKDGARGTDDVDMTGVVMGAPAFAPLRDEDAFAAVQVVDWGSGVEWTDDLDYSAVTLYELAREQRAWDHHAFRQWLAAMHLSSNEAADILGLTNRTVLNYKAGDSPIPTSVQIACRAMADNPVLFLAHYRPRKAGRPPKSGRKSA